MPPKKSHSQVEKTLAHNTLQLTHELSDLTKEVANLKNLEFMKVFKHPVKFMWFSFLKGLMIGFGSVLGASVLVALFVYILAQIKLVPFVGDFVEDIIDEVEQKQTEEPKVQEATPNS